MRCAAPRTLPPNQSAVMCAFPPARCMHASVARRLPPPGLQPAPHRVPCLRPSAVRVRLQPAAALGHLPRHGHGLHVLGARCSPPPRPPRYLQSHLLPAAAGRCVHAALAHRLPPPRTLLAPRPRAPSLSWQFANSLSAANKLIIRCAWAGTPAFASAGYGSGWAPGSCSPPPRSVPDLMSDACPAFCSAFCSAFLFGR